MKIAVWHSLPSGGGKRALYGHVNGLLSRGHEVEVWEPVGEERRYLPLSDLAPVHQVPLPEILGGRAALAVRQVVLDRDMAHDMYNIHCQLVGNAIMQGGFDVLFANTAATVHSPPLSQHVIVPSLLYLQEPQRRLYEALPIPPLSAGPMDLRERPWRRGIAFARWMYETRRKGVKVRNEVYDAAGYDCIAVNSLYSRESVLRAYGLNSTVCYLGVDVELFTPLARPRRDYLVTVGAGTPLKNLKFIVEALGTVPERERLPLEWVANSAHSGEVEGVKQLAEYHKVDLRLHINISDHDLVVLLGGALALVYAPRLEPFGLAPLEAAACGVPTVAVAEGGVRESVEDGRTGILTGGEVSDFSAGLLQVLRNRALASRLGASARYRVEERWTLEHAAQRLEMLLVDVAAGRRVGTRKLVQ